MHKLVFLLAIALPAFFADQLTKFIVYATLTYRPADGSALEQFFTAERSLPKPPYELIPDVWDFRYSENNAGAFSMLQNASASIRGPFFLLMTLIVVPLLVRYYLLTKPGEKLRAIAMPLVVGGALGNFCDRLHFGYVIDFIHWHFHSFEWPVFNIADVVISIGALLLLFESLRSPRAKMARG